MTLPYDYARCSGTPRIDCLHCLRRTSPGRPEWQSYIPPEFDPITGACPNRIDPAQYASGTTKAKP